MRSSASVGRRHGSRVAGPLADAEDHELGRLVDVDLELREAAHRFVRRRLVHAALHVATRVDAAHESARRQQQPAWRSALRWALEWIENLDPWMVERGVLAVELPAEVADLG